MASQLAAQDYLSRLQTAARDPAAYAAFAANSILPNYDLLAQGSKSRDNSLDRGEEASSKASRESR